MNARNSLSLVFSGAVCLAVTAAPPLETKSSPDLSAGKTLTPYWGDVRVIEFAPFPAAFGDHWINYSESLAVGNLLLAAADLELAPTATIQAYRDLLFEHPVAFPTMDALVLTARRDLMLNQAMSNGTGTGMLWAQADADLDGTGILHIDAPITLTGSAFFGAERIELRDALDIEQGIEFAGDVELLANASVGAPTGMLVFQGDVDCPEPGDLTLTSGMEVVLHGNVDLVDGVLTIDGPFVAEGDLAALQRVHLLAGGTMGGPGDQVIASAGPVIVSDELYKWSFGDLLLDSLTLIDVDGFVEVCGGDLILAGPAAVDQYLAVEQEILFRDEVTFGPNASLYAEWSRFELGTIEIGADALGALYGCHHVQLQAPTTLRLDLAEPPVADWLDIMGTVLLDGGLLELSFLGGYEPQLGDGWEIITAVNVEGVFSDLIGVDDFAVWYEPEAVIVGTDCNGSGIPDLVETRPEYDPMIAQARNDCSAAEYVTPGVSYLGDTAGATPDGYANCGPVSGVLDVWYRYRPAWTGIGFMTVYLPSAPPTGPNPLIFAVHEGCPATPDNLVACSYPNPFGVNFPVKKGQEYLIRIAYREFGTGPFEMSLVGPDAVLNLSDFNASGVPDTCECLADVNDDGVVDGADFALVITSYGVCDGCPEDVDGSGVVDENDLYEVLVNMGPCP